MSDSVLSPDPPPTEEPASSGPRAPKPVPGLLLSFVKDFTLAVLFALFVLVFLYQPFRVEGVSMLPHFADRDRIIVNKLSYRLGEIERGDVVVFWYPEDPDKSFIKRVIGIPGDTIEIRSGAVYRNGEPLDEPYVREDFRTHESRPSVAVKRGYYYVLGDHRSKSFDSRFWGLVPQRYIYGKVVLSYWPPEHLSLP